ncbi:MAG: hypothetical protein ABI091_02705, partial [Ferruginibacter sp.]
MKKQPCPAQEFFAGAITKSLMSRPHNLNYQKMKKALHYLKLKNYYSIGLGICIFCFLSSMKLEAQDCKPDKTVNDKFTRAKYDYYNFDLKSTNNFLTNTSTSATFSFAVVNDTAIIAVLTFKQIADKHQRDLNPLAISKGSELYIANDAASIKLICRANAVSKNKNDILSGNINQTLAAEFELPIADLETFS